MHQPSKSEWQTSLTTGENESVFVREMVVVDG